MDSKILKIDENYLYTWCSDKGQNNWKLLNNNIPNNKNNVNTKKDHLVKFTFYITYAFLLTSAILLPLKISKQFIIPLYFK